MSVEGIPTRLSAPSPTWHRDVDVLVLGSGAAGLAAALAARPVRDVLVVTKDVLSAGSTAWAQGGLAGVLDPTDSLEHHVADTLSAGAGLCDERVVRQLVEEAPIAIRYLMQLGAAFDPGADGSVALTREGGHSHNRIVHSGGDRSGAEVQRTLDESVLAAGVSVMEWSFALDLLTGTNRRGQRQVAGVRIALTGPTGEVRSVGDITARAVVLATGGYGQIFASTSNPPAVTGDGLAMALRAGVAVTDVEFVQFHPTVMWRGPDARGQQALVSEAVRGEGGVLVDAAGDRVMVGLHPLGDLAPRDVVAAAISARMAEAPVGVYDHVYLDATNLGTRFYERFPTITAACREAGLDPARQRIPVAPAAHYACGGVRAELDGTTAVPGLFAVGEVSMTGVHGANRLASNSLTESVVAGTKLGRDLEWSLPERVEPDEHDEHDEHDEAVGRRARDTVLVAAEQRRAIRTAMSLQVGVLRDGEGLASAIAGLARVSASASSDVVPSREAWESTNALTVAAVMSAAALARTESRGCHRRTDHPDTIDAWRTHLKLMLADDGSLTVSGTPVTA